jgi:phage/plasmid-associated DNA primase
MDKNTIQCFIKAKCVLGARHVVFKDDLYEVYDKYCLENDLFPFNRALFFKKLQECFSYKMTYRPRINGKTRGRCVRGLAIAEKTL